MGQESLKLNHQARLKGAELRMGVGVRDSSQLGASDPSKAGTQSCALMTWVHGKPGAHPQPSAPSPSRSDFRPQFLLPFSAVSGDQPY